MSDYIYRLFNRQRPQPVQYQPQGFLDQEQNKNDPFNGGLLNYNPATPGFNPTGGLLGDSQPQSSGPLGDSQGLLNAGASLLAQSRSNQPVSFGQALGQGLLAYSDGQRQAQEDQFRQQGRQLQLADLQSRAQDRALERDDFQRQKEAQDNFVAGLKNPNLSRAEKIALAVQAGQSPSIIDAAGPQAPNLVELIKGNDVVQGYYDENNNFIEQGRGSRFAPQRGNGQLSPEAAVARETQLIDAQLRAAGIDPNSEQGAAFKRQQLLGKNGTDQPRQLEANERARLFDLSDSINRIDSLKPSLDRAIQLSDKAYSGYAAGTRALIGSAAGDADAAVTQEYQSIITDLALQLQAENLKGATSDRDVQLLLNSSGGLELNPKARTAILQRLAQKLSTIQQRNAAEAEALRTGNYYQPGFQNTAGTPQPQSQTNNADPLGIR